MPGLLIGMYFEELARVRKKQQDKAKRSRLKLKDSVQEAGRRIKSERDVYKVLRQSLHVHEPLRKACGIFSDDAAQILLK